MTEDEKVKVLMVSLPLQGHINPMLKLAKRLISKGVHVTIATTEYARHRIEQDPQNSEIKFEFFSDGLAGDFDRSNNEALINSLKVEGSKNLSTLITNLTKVHNYSCVIVNPFVPFAIEVAVDQGIPCALLWIQACALYSIYYRYFKNIDFFPDLKDPNEKVQLPCLPKLEVRDLPSLILPSSPHYFWLLMKEFVQALDKVKWVLGTSFYEIEEEIVNSMASLTPIYPIGPLVSPFMLGKKETNVASVDMWNAEDSCIEWLDSKPPSSVIYVSFGSITVLSQKQKNNIATALKNSNISFLWVVRPRDIGGSQEDGAELPLEFFEKTKGRGLVVRWCQQEKVLIHPAVACFISHCGWNSTLETVVAGVPVIGYPDWTDQRTNAMLIEHVFQNGVKVNFEEDGVASAEEIERCINKIMEGPRAIEIRKRAMEMKDAANKALLEGSTSDKNINLFISDLIAKKTTKA
ncbi:hypothetical protein RIF29_33785 [Crotalaria pallida]|uniref:Glycosyltransferase n=1 Tax=Crotalaria pallida TaxID=3830 RepID=A0AAN9HQW8_CROPI